MASPRSSHHPILESGTRTLPWHLISTSSRSSCQSSWCLSHPYQCRETVSCLPLPLRHTTLSHSLHALHVLHRHLCGRLLRHSHWRCLLCGLLIHHLLFFQPLFIAAYDFALTVDLDLGRDVPRALRLLMLPTNEFFAIDGWICTFNNNRINRSAIIVSSGACAIVMLQQGAQGVFAEPRLLRDRLPHFITQHERTRQCNDPVTM